MGFQSVMDFQSETSVFKFPGRSVKEKFFMHFQSETRFSIGV